MGTGNSMILINVLSFFLLVQEEGSGQEGQQDCCTKTEKSPQTFKGVTILHLAFDFEQQVVQTYSLSL